MKFFSCCGELGKEEVGVRGGEWGGGSFAHESSFLRVISVLEYCVVSGGVEVERTAYARRTEADNRMSMPTCKSTCEI